MQTAPITTNSISIEDNIESIFETLKDVVLLHRDGETIEIDFSQIRPRGDIISSTQKPSAGPVAFLKIFDQALSAINSKVKKDQPDKAIISIEHPDILDFINYKPSFSIAVRVTPTFMRAVESGSMYDLRDPRDQNPVNKLDAKSVFDILSEKTTQGDDFGIIYPSEKDVQSALPFDKRMTHQEVIPPPVIGNK